MIRGKNRLLWPLYANESLRGIAASWLSIFSSVFIYRQLLPFLDSRLALTGVFLFWAVFGLSKLLGTSLAENLSLRRGLKTQVGLGLGLLALAAGFFSLVHFQWLMLLLGMASWGFSAGLYWFGWHALVGKLGKQDHYGRAYGTSAALATATNVFTPLVGGILIDWGGYRLLFGVALVIVFLALLALRFLKEEKTHQDATLKQVFRLFLSHKKIFLIYFSLGALVTITSGGFILYLALILKKELALGGFFSASLLLVAVIRWLIGRLIDLGEEKKLIVLGSVSRTLVWLGRLLTRNVPWLLGLNVLNDLAIGMVGMPLGVLSLQKGVDGKSMGRAVLFREVAISFGEMTSGLFLAALVFVGLPLEVGFVLAVPLSLVPILIYGKNK